MKKQLFFLGILSLMTCGRVFSADGTPGDWQARRQAVRQYVKEHITPLILQKRQVLENELTTVEKNDIAECRASLKAINAQRRQLMELKPKDVDMHTYMEGEAHEKFTELRQQDKLVMERVEAIAANHTLTLDRMRTDLEPTVKQWKEDIARIHSQNTENNTEWQHGPRGMEHGMLHGLNGKNAQARFLLMSPIAAQNTADENDNSNELKSDLITPANPTPVSINDFQIGPNPATSELVTGNNAIPAQNELTIFDMQGKIVMVSQNIQSAQHIDVSQLAGGAYIVRMQSGDQSVSSKLVISR